MRAMHAMRDMDTESPNSRLRKRNMRTGNSTEVSMCTPRVNMRTLKGKPGYMNPKNLNMAAMECTSSKSSNMCSKSGNTVRICFPFIEYIVNSFSIFFYFFLNHSRCLTMSRNDTIQLELVFHTCALKCHVLCI